MEVTKTTPHLCVFDYCMSLEPDKKCVSLRDISVKSNTIEWFRFFCIGAVVLLHAVGSRLIKENAIVFVYSGVFLYME